jgi:TetR/AcrR family transcriptional repressor of nem operon
LQILRSSLLNARDGTPAALIFVTIIMKITKAKADEHRQRILSAATVLYRERGVEGIGVADITRAAGLTHGAFYTHFADKATLFGTACETALLAAAERIAAYREVPGMGLEQLIEYFLSERHITDWGQGCTVAALGADSGRQQQPVHEAFARGLSAYLDSIAAFTAGDTPAEQRLAALRSYATVLGAVLMARATYGTPLATEILEAVRAHPPTS